MVYTRAGQDDIVLYTVGSVQVSGSENNNKVENVFPFVNTWMVWQFVCLCGSSLPFRVASYLADCSHV